MVVLSLVVPRGGAVSTCHTSFVLSVRFESPMTMIWWLLFYGMWRHVIWNIGIDIWEVPTSSIFKVTWRPNTKTSPLFFKWRQTPGRQFYKRNKRRFSKKCHTFFYYRLTTELSEWRHYYFDSSNILFTIKMKVFWKYRFCFFCVIDALWIWRSGDHASW